MLGWSRTAVRGCRAVLTSKPSRRAGLALSIIGVTLVGIVVGTLLGGRMQTDIGPFRAEMAITPSVEGGTTVTIPPLGALQLSSHAGPAHLSVRLGSLDQRRTEALIDDPANISRASQTAVSDVTNGVIRVGVRTVAVSVLATMILAALVFRRTRRVAWAGGLAMVVTGGSLGIAALTFRPDSIEEPRYEGLLVNAPAIVGDARRIANDYGRYADQLQRMVGNVSQLYTTVSTLPVFEQAQGTVRVLHVSDLHLNPTAWQVVRTVVEQFKIDVVIDTGDMTDWGSEPEASFVGSIGLLKVPYVFIRGNHDSPATAAAVSRQRNAIVLDNAIVPVAGLTIAGIGDPGSPRTRRPRRPARAPCRRRSTRWPAPVSSSPRPSGPTTGRSTSPWCTTRRRPTRSPASYRWCWPGTPTTGRCGSCHRCRTRCRPSYRCRVPPAGRGCAAWRATSRHHWRCPCSISTSSGRSRRTTTSCSAAPARRRSTWNGTS
ncbi:hypothetical protein GCM10027615_30450 [Plantactinospora veratri]